MTDYGHELEFGLFPTPDAAAAHHVLELAAVAEVSGLDLVTVQDHPYQARHLDAWTLLSVIAARTSTLRVALNVANLPLRNPVVLAGSVASLDLLSGGRVELGHRRRRLLGRHRGRGRACASPRVRRSRRSRRPSASSAAMWAGEGSVRVDGAHHRAVGLHAGPGAGAPGGHLGRRLQAADAAAHRPARRRLAAEPGLRGARRARADERRASTRPRSTAGRAPEAVRRLYNVSGSFGVGRRVPARAGPPTGPSSSRRSPSSRGWPPTSWPPTTWTTCAASARRSPRRCATSSPPSASAGATGPRDRMPCRRLPLSRHPERVELHCARTPLPQRIRAEPTRRHTDARRRHPAHRHPAVGRGEPADLPGAARPGRAGGLPTGPAGGAAAPHGRARPPARGADPGARRRRAGGARAPRGGRGALGGQRDDDAPEQLDPRRLLRVVLPAGDRAPRARGHRDLPAPARQRPRRGPGHRPARGGARGDPRRARRRRPGARGAGGRRAGGARSGCSTWSTCSPTRCCRTWPTRSASCCTRWPRHGFYR